MSRILKVAELETCWYKECHLGKTFDSAFEDDEEENTMSIVGQGDLMIFSKPIELSKLCPSSKYS